MPIKMTKIRDWLKHIPRGFTLIEILLVLVIISMLLFLGMKYVEERTDAMQTERAGLQLQQILNAGLSYYVANGKWPENLSDLQPNYLSPNLKTPFRNNGEYGIHASSSFFYAYIKLNAADSHAVVINNHWAYQHASTIARMLPMGWSSALSPQASLTSSCPTDNFVCYAIGSVNIPGQNLNNASAVNYSGLYHSGACVPTPHCPVDKDGNAMKPNIFVIPIQVSGINDDPNGNKPTIYPISGFRAFAKGPKDPKHMENCKNTEVTECSLPGGAASDALYWRVCVQATTEKGFIDPSNAAWGSDMGTVVAFTRCTINNEPTGSDFDVWSQ